MRIIKGYISIEPNMPRSSYRSRALDTVLGTYKRARALFVVEQLLDSNDDDIRETFVPKRNYRPLYRDAVSITDFDDL